MIIGIDASKSADKKKTGVENFVYQFIWHLAKIDTKNSYYLFTDKHLPIELLQNNNFQEIFIPFPKFWHKIRLPLALIKHKPDVFLAPAYQIPAFAPHKSIGVIHDLASIKFPKAYSKRELLFQKTALINISRKAQKIVCVSNSTKDDLEKYLPATRDRVEVIYPGINETIKRKTGTDVLGLKSKYFLVLGRLEKRKNTENIIGAFAKLKKMGFAHKLVLVGKPGYGFRDIELAIKLSVFTKDIVTPGYLSDTMVNDLLNGAEALVYPSLYEGFGLPALEAMQVGTPVITSCLSSLPEITGKAAILVDPKSQDEIYEAMKSITTNSTQRTRLIEEGFQQAEKFSWEKTANQYLKLMEEM